jgi:hypothetical protein
MVAAPDTVSFGVNDIRGRLDLGLRHGSRPAGDRRNDQQHSVAGPGHDPRMPTGRATCDLSPATVMGPA